MRGRDGVREFRLSLQLGFVLFAVPWLPALAQSPDTVGAPSPAAVTLLPEVAVSAPAASILDAPSSASSGTVTRDELLSRPVIRPGELLEAVPGLIATQHSGEGKANQWFLRGFDLDHGTDLAVSLDGMPLNMPTHAHGQGYADTNFLIPELLGPLTFHKGPYYAAEGDFSTAGAVHLEYLDALPAGHNFVSGTVGSFGYWRGLGITSQRLANGVLLLAGEVNTYDGPWDHPDNVRKLNGVARYSQGGAEDGFSVTLMGYSNRWNATNQVPVDAVSSGLIDRYGTLDPSDGGKANRYSVSGEWHHTSDWGTTRASLYAVRSTLDLWNDFTYYLADPVNGDQFHQADRRWILGGALSQTVPHTLLGLPSETEFGVQTRYDNIRLGLFDTANRRYLSTVLVDRVDEGSLGFFAENRTALLPWLRATLGIRGDVFAGQVRSDTPANSGSDAQFLPSPKFSLTAGPFLATELFLNGGFGFHSNDFRGATITVDPNDRLTPLTRVPLLVRSRGAEIGLRTRPLPGLESTVSVFVLDFDSELVFSGDTGTTEAGRPSRRLGVEWTGRYQVLPWLTLDGAITYTQARFTDFDPVGSRIPGAAPIIASAGITMGEGQGWFGDARLRVFGPRPLIEDASARSPTTALVNARVGYRFANGITAQLDALNLFNSKSDQIDYFYQYRLPGQSADGVMGRVFHPVEPLAVRFTLAATF